MLRHPKGTMFIPRVAVVAFAMLIGSWLSYDGARSFLTGDYTTRSSGAHAHQLGPWAALVRFVHLDPRGVPMKTLHVVLGVFWCVGALAFLLRSTIAYPVLMGCAVGSLWYLPFGAIVGAIEIALLVWLRRKGLA